MKPERNSDFAKPLTAIERVLMFLVYWLGTYTYRLLCYTLRVKVAGNLDACRRSHTQGGMIGACWHQRLFCVPFILRKVPRMGLLVSQSKDGEMIRYVLAGMGHVPIQGSSSRRGALAYVEMVEHLKSGGNMGITPDGPRGPARVVQRGAPRLAVEIGATIMPIAVSARPCLFALSWDAFLFPMPFAKTVLWWADPIVAVKGGGEAEIERVGKLLAQRMDEATEQADRLLNVKAPRKGGRKASSVRQQGLSSAQ